MQFIFLSKSRLELVFPGTESKQATNPAMLLPNSMIISTTKSNLDIIFKTVLLVTETGCCLVNGSRRLILKVTCSDEVFSQPPTGRKLQPSFMHTPFFHDLFINHVLNSNYLVQLRGLSTNHFCLR